MKSAVELALYEIEKRNNNKSNNEGGKTADAMMTKNDSSVDYIKPKSKYDNSMELNESSIKRIQEMSVKRIQDLEGTNDERIKKLEQELETTKALHSLQMKHLKEDHAKETSDMEKRYTDFVTGLVRTHEKELDGLREEMKDMKNVHGRFLESYVEASLDLLGDADDHGSNNVVVEGGSIDDVDDDNYDDGV